MNKDETIQTITQACTLMTQLASGFIALIDENKMLSSKLEATTEVADLVKQVVEEHGAPPVDRAADWQPSAEDILQLNEALRSAKKVLQGQAIPDLLDRLAKSEFSRGKLYARIQNLDTRCTALEDNTKTIEAITESTKDEVARLESEAQAQSEKCEAMQRKLRIINALVSHVRGPTAQKIAASPQHEQQRQAMATWAIAFLREGGRCSLEFDQETARRIAKLAAKIHADQPGAPRYLADAAHPDWIPHDWVVEAVQGSLVYLAGVVQDILDPNKAPDIRVDLPSWFPKEDL